MVFPLKWKLILSKTKVIAFICCVFVSYLAWSSFITSHANIFGFPRADGSTLFACTVKTYRGVVGTTYAIVDSGLPMIIVATGNIVIATSVVYYKRQTAEIRKSQAQGSDSKLYLTTCSVSLTFLVLTFPITLYYSMGRKILGIQIYSNPYNPYYLVADSMSYANFATNFILYVAFTQSFRKELKVLLRCCKCFNHEQTSLQENSSGTTLNTVA